MDSNQSIIRTAKENPINLILFLVLLVIFTVKHWKWWFFRVGFIGVLVISIIYILYQQPEIVRKHWKETSEQESLDPGESFLRSVISSSRWIFGGMAGGVIATVAIADVPTTIEFQLAALFLAFTILLELVYRIVLGEEKI